MSSIVKNLVQKMHPHASLGRFGDLYTDTTEFMRIDHGDVIHVGGLHYLVLRNEKESSFGVEDPKYWVKRCRELETGERKILKLVFYEKFPITLGSVEVVAYRSPRKEARILDLVRGDCRFMQGFSVDDSAGNNVRILSVVRGKRLAEVVDAIDVDHRTYFFDFFPGMLEKFVVACEAIRFLHAHGENHGDIRLDHLFMEYSTGNYVWIDFDYTYDFHENPFGVDLFGLGNMLLFLVGKRFYTPQNLAQWIDDQHIGGLVYDDFSLLFKSRLVNIAKMYPYIPKELTMVLMHFSLGAQIFYTHVDDFLADLNRCIKVLRIS
ncbi:MAG: serine/threonine protein kinase [Desulfoplanes sp.]|nr:serine/threonine protein kinase [Desulfoplanes sp.]